MFIYYSNSYGYFRASLVLNIGMSHAQEPRTLIISLIVSRRHGKKCNQKPSKRWTMKDGVLMCGRCPVIHVWLYPIPCNTDHVYIFRQILGGCLCFMFNNFRRTINITKGKTTRCDDKDWGWEKSEAVCSVVQFFLRFPAAEYKVSRLYTTLHHFLSISSDEQWSIMSHILL